MFPSNMKYLHTMVRVTDLEQSLDFYCRKLGLQGAEAHGERQGDASRLVFLAAPGDEDAQIELTLQPGSAAVSGRA